MGVGDRKVKLKLEKEVGWMDGWVGILCTVLYCVQYEGKGGEGSSKGPQKQRQ